MAATMLDRITLLPMIGLIIGKALITSIQGLFRGSQYEMTYGDYVIASVVRGGFTSLSVGQIQMLLKPFVQVYEDYCKQNKLIPIVEDIPNTNIKGFWMGSKETAKYVMIYYHGGGFVMAGLPPHIDLLKRMVEWSNGNLAVFCPCYTLAPEGLYPLQISQCVEGLRYILSNHSPESILLGGDSAGGNLVLAVLSHISGHQHPQSSIVKQLGVSKPLRGAILISPWTSSDSTRFESVKTNAGVDTVNASLANYWSATYRGSKDIKVDEYIEPELATSIWWSDLKASNVLITAGNNEVLRDPIIETAQKMQKGAKSTDLKLIVAKSEVHDGPLPPKPTNELDKLGDACSEGAIRNWIKTKL